MLVSLYISYRAIAVLGGDEEPTVDGLVRVRRRRDRDRDRPESDDCLLVCSPAVWKRGARGQRRALRQDLAGSTVVLLDLARAVARAMPSRRSSSRSSSWWLRHD